MDILSFLAETPEQFWDEFREIASNEYRSTSLVEQGLAAILRLISQYLDEYVTTDVELAKFASFFIQSSIFNRARGYIRRKLICSLSGDVTLSSECKTFIGAVLLMDSREQTSTLDMIQEEYGVHVLLKTVLDVQDKFSRLTRTFLELVYETCKVKKLHRKDLEQISPSICQYLFSMIESPSYYDEKDPQAFSFIKVLLSINEQFMVNALDARSIDDQIPLENTAFNVLKSDMNSYRAFGENIVFFFNRITDKCLQLMMMKFLYLIFTSKETYQFIYLNDLKVFVDILIRDLTDISDEEEVLRHTYLRILYPLLKHTQLGDGQYKKTDIIMVLEHLAYPSTPGYTLMNTTTQSLAARCLTVEWLQKELIKENVEDDFQTGTALPITHPLSRSSSISTDSSDDSAREQVIGLVAENNHYKSFSPNRPQPPPPRHSSFNRKVLSGYFVPGHNGSDVDIATYTRLQSRETRLNHSPSPTPPISRLMRCKAPPIPPPPRTGAPK